MTVHTSPHQWPAEGLTRVPYWIYSDPDLCALEQERIFRGNTWNFLCLEAELPRPNTFRTSNLGDMSVVVTRDSNGAIHAFENRCAHRGALLCLLPRGERKEFACVYHNWTYDLAGNLTGVAFRRGIGGKGGMSPEATPERHAPRKLRVEVLAGLVFGTLGTDPPPLEAYLGPEIVRGIRRVMRAPVRLLGGYSQSLSSNWKLYMENTKDSYHASLLHMFFTTFRLNRLSQKGGLVVNQNGAGHISYSMAADVAGSEYPEGLNDEEKEETAASLVVIRLDPDQLHLPAHLEGYDAHGILAYSRICTHAGCAITLYRAPLFQPDEPRPALVCPCHYSTFNPATGGKVTFGPAGRDLPLLPVYVDSSGYLRAKGNFDGPVGPSWWGVRMWKAQP